MAENTLPTNIEKRELDIKSEFAKKLSKEITTKRIIVSLVGIVGLAVIAPLTYIAVISGLGLVAVGTLGLGGFFVWKEIPLWIQKKENYITERIQIEENEHLKKMKLEARKNPVEQLQNHLKLTANRLEKYKKFVSEFGAKVKTKEDMLADRKKRKPNNDYSKNDLAIESMQKVYNFHLTKIDEGNKVIDDIYEKIDDAEFNVDFSDIGTLAIENMPGSGDGQIILDNILANEAFNEARSRYNQVLTDIEVQIGAINSGIKLEFGEDTIDMSGFHIPTIKELSNV